MHQEAAFEMNFYTPCVLKIIQVIYILKQHDNKHPFSDITAHGPEQQGHFLLIIIHGAHPSA